MKDWGLIAPDWYALPRPERAYMLAQTRAERLLNAMLQHDMNEDAKQEARIKAEQERRKRR